MLDSKRGLVSRRQFVNSFAAAAGLAIAGFDPRTGLWVNAAQAQGSSLQSVPPLDGALVQDPGALELYSQDFGHIAHRTPRAILRAASVEDVVKMVRFANDNDLKVTMRGQGHAQHGQGLVAAGILIDSTRLNSIALGTDSVEVGAGALWGQVINATLPAGLTPAVMVDTLSLSVGGVLAGSGGYGIQSTRYGLHTDQVTALEVVTGNGERVRCSRTERTDLFDAMLIGQGQCGLILSAALQLMRAPQAVRLHTLTYSDLATCVADAAQLTRDNRFDIVAVTIGSAPSGGNAFALIAGSYTTQAAEPNAQLLAGLKYTKSSSNSTSYERFLRRVEGPLAAMQATAEWQQPHPWFGVLIPASKLEQFVAPILTNPKQLAGTPPFLRISLLPLARSRLRSPLMCAPAEDVMFGVTLLRTVSADALDEVLAVNRALYERARDLGGKRMTWGAIPFSASDWVTHYGPELWPRLQRAKQHYDKRNVLTPGPGIFSTSSNT